MKTFFTTVLALSFLCFNAFSQIDNSLDPNYSYQGQNPDALIAPGTGGGTVNEPAESSRNSTFCDNFNVPNTTTITGWTEQKGDWQIVNNMLINTPPVMYDWKYITVDGSSRADGCITARAIYGTVTETKFVGVVGRFYDENTNILFKIQDNGASGYWSSYWIYFGHSGIYSEFGNFGNDAIIQMEYSGINITIRIDVDRDGTWDYTNTMTTTHTSSGLSGLAGYYSSFTDDFCCGTDCSGAGTVPLSNMGLYLALLLSAGFVIFMVYRRA
jgi:hypothetical protein